ncbi:unnamed protein product [Blepharisma stoltei]|uniref:Uncharacterized protein n=1 Tax=Blepharisma stoltei TaxID=1481888 RepID=A0AAU9J203_9CILI|nr:unnamed protein product [Blepharisma stoltei]
MEAQVHILVRLEDEEPQELPAVPLNIEELCNLIYKSTGAIHFKVKYRDAIISNTEQLLTAYLENKEPTLEFVIEEELSMPSYIGSSIQNVSQSLRQPKKLIVSNGVISKADLLALIEEIGNAAQKRVAETYKSFLNKRQEFYSIDEGKWQLAAFEHLQFQETLLAGVLGDVCKQAGINPLIFNTSCRANETDQEVRDSLERMTTKLIQVNVQKPESLTKEVFHQIMEYQSQFLENFLQRNPPRFPADVILLHFREGDELMKIFGYDENEISAAMSEFKFETDGEWEPLRKKLHDAVENCMSGSQ